MLSCLPYPPAAPVPPPPPGAPSTLPPSFTSLPMSSEAVVLAENLTSSFLPLSIIRLRSLGSRGDLEPLALRVGVKELGGRGIGSRGAGAFPLSVSVHELLCHSLVHTLIRSLTNSFTDSFTLSFTHSFQSGLFAAVCVPCTLLSTVNTN